jgi:hypothetical protein
MCPFRSIELRVVAFALRGLMEVDRCGLKTKQKSVAGGSLVGVEITTGDSEAVAVDRGVGKCNPNYFVNDWSIEPEVKYDGTHQLTVKKNLNQGPDHSLSDTNKFGVVPKAPETLEYKTLNGLPRIHGGLKGLE